MYEILGFFLPSFFFICLSWETGMLKACKFAIQFFYPHLQLLSIDLMTRGDTLMLEFLVAMALADKEIMGGIASS